MPVKKIKEFLDSHKVKYISLSHSPAFTAQEVAAAAHVSGRQFAKTVMVKVDGQLAMVVVPANDQVHFAKLREALGTTNIELASESEFKDKFAGCEVGAMPPFGMLYDMPVYLADRLSSQEQIIFNAGSHSELLQLAYSDFEKIAKPTIVAI